MKYFKYSVSLMVILILSLVFIGCAKPPDAEKSAANAAMTAAGAAGADKYAAADLGAAKKIWDAAEAQMKDKKYNEAKQAYIDAKAAFEKATAAAAAGKKAAVAEVNASLVALEEAWLKLEAGAKNVEKKMKDKKEAWTADATAFAERLKAAKESVAADPIGAKAKIAELKSVIDKWDATFTELAAMPVKPEPTKKGAKKK
ncbi:MAG: hypothetical protein CVU52_08345 [Deltaproteobacteria bacterium HGW-Deltaproteobacteria-10]|nr:MAG: hypothetical protein CVU52_08345 [Deltaproteobacteria bacterium HGW-Deltaproteobacteria-10]